MSRDDLVDKLRAALALVETLKAENTGYRDALDTLKASCGLLEEQHDAAVRELDIATKEKKANCTIATQEMLEQDSAQATEFWRKQLEDRERELADIKSKCSPPSVEAIRLEVRGELEETYRAKSLLVARDAEKYRELYYKSRREVESLRMDLDQKV
nr:hypothetical protein HK105_005466 [Polyrhizophydium stewartii]